MPTPGKVKGKGPKRATKATQGKSPKEAGNNRGNDRNPRGRRAQPATQGFPPDQEGPFTGWKKRLNVYTNRVEYEIAIVEIWIDPTDAQKSWGNIRAAVQQYNRLRMLQNQDYGQ